MKSLVWPAIEAYAEAHSATESEVCRALREETYRSMDVPQRVVGPLEGPLLKVVADHVLWSGEVLLQPPPDRSTAVMQELNRIIAADPGVMAVLVTIRDGVFVVRPTGARKKTS